MYDLKKISKCMYVLDKTKDMKVPCLIVATDKLLKDLQLKKPLEQLKNIACLDGVLGYSIAMPDIHWGYGFPIGAVAAMDMENGVVSPGGVGYDINCGVRFALAPIEYNSISDKIKKDLLKEIFRLIPSGVGSKQSRGKPLSEEDYKKIAEKGSMWSFEEGFGLKEDIYHTEDNGYIETQGIENISLAAKERGKNQLGSLGSGNHFIEIGYVDEIKNKEISKIWGVKKGFTYILIHSGSRGFGHQVCQDALGEFVKKGYAENLKDKQLVSVKIKSDLGQKYINNMAVAANFAFNNRQRILHYVRKSFFKILNIKPEEIKQLYDVCHNIAKFEEHEVKGVKKKLCVHRKGATRAFGKNEKQLPYLFQKTGQPVLVPGDMASCSYLMVGLGNSVTYKSACHGSGRAMSRVQSFKKWKNVDLIDYMKKMKILVMASSRGTIAEEMPDAYKDVREVAKASEGAKLANIVAKLKPGLVVKG